MPASAPSASKRSYKKVYSKPVDQTVVQDSRLKQIATEYDYGGDVGGLSKVTSEEARKKLRIDRLRAEQLNKECNPSIVSNKDSINWQKEQELKKI
jgi:hypothetical protein